MKKLVIVFFSLLFSATALTQPFDLKKDFRQARWFNDSLKQIIADAGLAGSFDAGEDGMEQVSFAVIDLTHKKPLLGGVNMDNFIYPASVYKMYVAMEVLKQVSESKYSLYDAYVVHSPNDVDHSSEIKWDPRPLLRGGDTVTLNYLIDLMITRSDNSAANCLIDIAGRKNINNTMHQYGWYGSEVTRKFLSRKFEDPGYDTIKGTETSALHAALFMYGIYKENLVNFWVSKELYSFLSRQLDTTKLATGLPRSAVFAHKSGWWSYYTNDVGIVEDGKVKFIISLFTPVPEEEARPRMKLVAARVYQLLLRRK
ncbi:MAG: class A beta-lactamase-related serine hydrolase [Chitinophagaceae bacterium]|nr:class A beta-lactamase-related serine hydrolase [Chitinophagaceae bacterium]MCW5915343.1 serine hydrolase [Chitinophagaceae bacterium]